MANNQQLLLGEGAGGGIPNYIEEVFNTFVWTGTGSSQTLTTGVDTATHGGLFWTKNRTNVFDHALWSTNFSLAGNYLLKSNTTGALTYGTYGTGDYVSNSTTGVTVYGNSQNYVTWTFRKQPKFFDVVTYTGTGSNTTIAHTLGAVPGCIIVKRTDTTADWAVYHRSLANTQYLVLNTTAAAATGATWWNSTTPTSSVFSIGTDASVNASGGTYVAYIYAHDAGGFGLAGTDNVISCGTWTGTGAAFTVSLGYEPQWLMFKRTDDAGDWVIIDNMRGFTTTGADAYLRPNTTGAEAAITGGATPNATGFGWSTGSGTTFIYIAIRRGPMKVPTVGTSVYNAIARTGTGATAAVTGVGFTPDLSLISERGTVFSGDKSWWDRLRGPKNELTSTAATAETARTDMVLTLDMDGETLGADSNWYVNKSGNPYINWFFKRAPGFFDEVCYAGTGSNLTVAHNLTVVPQLIIIKNRTNGWSWNVGYNFGVSSYDFLTLDNNDPGTNNAYSSHYTAAPTATQFFLATNVRVNQSSANFVAYLFSTLAGVSKVGTYTGTGTTQVINCGFTSGARFVMIKRTDNVGDWYVWDSARGIVAGNDPYLLLNSTAAEVTSTDYIDTAATGFEISSTAPGAVNFSGGSYIFLAIA